MSVKEKNRFKAIKKELKAIRKARVVLGAVGSHGDLSNADLLRIHEFGGGNVPARAPIRKTFGDEKVLRGIEDFAARILETVLEGKSAAKILQAIGLRMKTEVQRTIKNRLAPPNAPSTLKRKKGTVPLIDTQQLVNSIDFEVRK